MSAETRQFSLFGYQTVCVCVRIVQSGADTAAAIAPLKLFRADIQTLFIPIVNDDAAAAAAAAAVCIYRLANYT